MNHQGYLMFITCSKNCPLQIKNIAKNIASSIAGATFFPRSDRSVERMAELAQKKGENCILVLMQKEKNAIIAKYALGKEGWRWDENCIQISAVKKIADAPKTDLPIKIIFKSEEEKKLAEFLSLADELISDIYEEHYEICICAKKNGLKISCDKTDTFEAQYKWGKSWDVNGY
ncbi:MAG: hypothetical protein WC492_00855 [Candidatus Micrarchaeia archaeon]